MFSHSYNNNPNYGCTAVQSVFRPYKEPAVEYVEEKQDFAPEVPAKKKYLPGERLLKKLNKQQQKKNKKVENNINMETIQQSISEIIQELS